MKKFILVIFTLFILLSSFGCIDQPEPPGSDLPRLILDYDESTNETIIHMRGMEIIRYDNISIEINETKITRQDAFSIEERTELTDFELKIEAVQGEKIYRFNATLHVKPDGNQESHEEDLIFRITYPDEEKELVYRDDLPHRKVLDQIGDEET